MYSTKTMLDLLTSWKIGAMRLDELREMEQRFARAGLNVPVEGLQVREETLHTARDTVARQEATIATLRVHNAELAAAVETVNAKELETAKELATAKERYDKLWARYQKTRDALDASELQRKALEENHHQLISTRDAYYEDRTKLTTLRDTIAAALNCTPGIPDQGIIEHVQRLVAEHERNLRRVP